MLSVRVFWRYLPGESKAELPADSNHLCVNPTHLLRRWATRSGIPGNEFLRNYLESTSHLHHVDQKRFFSFFCGVVVGYG